MQNFVMIERRINMNPIVTIKIQNEGNIKVELYPEVAPNTVNNFISLVKNGFYNNLIFHRVIPGFMIQGGCPQGVGTGGPGYSIKGEFKGNGVKNDLKHTRGVISMARSGHPDSAGSQFFIMVEDAPHLDGQYAAFGKVIEGMEIADKIVNTKRDFRDKPYENQVMEELTVDTFGVEYEEPKKK
jgi:peptidyl-prolyl cis-trans isomerase B (cyclophilin B)